MSDILKIKWKSCFICTAGFQTMGLLNLLQCREENFKVLRESKSQIITAGKGRTIPWWGNQNKSINCYFFFSQFGDERYQNFKNYQCTSTLGGVSKEKEVSSVCFYQSCNFEMLLSVSFSSRPPSHECMLGFLSDTGQGQSVMQQF